MLFAQRQLKLTKGTWACSRKEKFQPDNGLFYKKIKVFYWFRQKRESLHRKWPLLQTLGFYCFCTTWFKFALLTGVLAQPDISELPIYSVVSCLGLEKDAAGLLPCKKMQEMASSWLSCNARETKHSQGLCINFSVFSKGKVLNKRDKEDTIQYPLI